MKKLKLSTMQEQKFLLKMQFTLNISNTRKVEPHANPGEDIQ